MVATFPWPTEAKAVELAGKVEDLAKKYLPPTIEAAPAPAEAKAVEAPPADVGGAN